MATETATNRAHGHSCRGERLSGLQSQVPKLVVYTKDRLREIEMGQELTIGRGYSNLLRLEGDEISRVHAIIYRRNGDFIVRDLDSKNGVFLNGSKVSYAQLGPGDRLQVGKYKMVFDPPASNEQNHLQQHDGYKPPEYATPLPSDMVGEHTSSGHVAAVAELSEVNPAAPPPASSAIYREEVILLTRPELDSRSASGSTEVSEQLARHRNNFFENLQSAPVQVPGALVQHALTAVVRAVAADRGVVILIDPKSGDLTSKAMVTNHGDVAVNRVVLRSSLTERKAILCPRTADSGLFRENDTVYRDRITSLISVPLGRDEPFGLLYLDRLGDADEFDVAHLYLAADVSQLLEMHLVETSPTKDAGNLH